MTPAGNFARTQRFGQRFRIALAPDRHGGLDVEIVGDGEFGADAVLIEFEAQRREWWAAKAEKSKVPT